VKNKNDSRYRDHLVKAGQVSLIQVSLCDVNELQHCCFCYRFLHCIYVLHEVYNVTKIYYRLETVSIAEPLQNRQHAQNP